MFALKCPIESQCHFERWDFRRRGGGGWWWFSARALWAQLAPAPKSLSVWKAALGIWKQLLQLPWPSLSVLGLVIWSPNASTCLGRRRQHHQQFIILFLTLLTEGWRIRWSIIINYCCSHHHQLWTFQRVGLCSSPTFSFAPPNKATTKKEEEKKRKRLREFPPTLTPPNTLPTHTSRSKCQRICHGTSE